MAGKVKKLQRMKARLAGETDASLEVAFELVCDCGQPIRGVRRTTSIQKECDQCGESLFVLPINVYPATKSVASEVIGGSFADRLRVVLGELLPARKPKLPAQKSANKETVDVAAVGERTTEEIVAPQPRRRLTLPKIDVKAAIRRTFTPFRLVMLAMISVVGLTGYWLVQQQAREAAQQVWLQAADEIKNLLQDGKNVELEQLLSKSVAAGRTLGKNDAEWRSIVNLYHETIAINNLAAIDLLSAFHGAYSNGVLATDGLQNLVGSAGNGTFIFDSWLSADYQQRQMFNVEMPAAAGKHRVSTMIALPQLEQLLQNFPDGRILFAAKIDSISPPQGDIEPQWNIKLVPESFVLLTESQLCQSVGLSTDFDQELAAILERQGEFVRTSETWEFRADDATVSISGETTPAGAAL